MAYTPTAVRAPTANDLADGPAAFNNVSADTATNFTAIKTELDSVGGLGAIKTGAPWDVVVGQAGDTTQRLLRILRMIGADQWEMRLEIDSATDPFVFQSLKNGVPVTRFSMEANGQLAFATGATWRTFPFATQVIQDSISVAGLSYATKKIDLAPNRFTTTPAVFVTSRSSIWMPGMATGNSKDSIYPYVRSYNNSVGGTGGAVGIDILAIQMTPSTSTPEG